MGRYRTYWQSPRKRPKELRCRQCRASVVCRVAGLCGVCWRAAMAPFARPLLQEFPKAGGDVPATEVG